MKLRGLRLTGSVLLLSSAMFLAGCGESNASSNESVRSVRDLNNVNCLQTSLENNFYKDSTEDNWNGDKEAKREWWKNFEEQCKTNKLGDWNEEYKKLSRDERSALRAKWREEHK